MIESNYGRSLKGRGGRRVKDPPFWTPLFVLLTLPGYTLDLGGSDYAQSCPLVKV